MALANIVLADAQATPVAHTFVPVGVDSNGVYWWEDHSAASPIGYWKISLDLRRPSVPTAGDSSTTQRSYKAKVGLHMPILENVTNSTVSGIMPAPTVSYVLRAFGGEYLIPERSTAQNRADLRRMYELLLGNSQVVAMIESLIKPVG